MVLLMCLLIIGGKMLQKVEYWFARAGLLGGQYAKVMTAALKSTVNVSVAATVKFEMPEELSLVNGFSVAVHYAGGMFGVLIDAVEVVGESLVFRSDHAGSSGNVDEGNVFAFEGVREPVTVRVTLRSKGSGPHDGNTKGDVYVVVSPPIA